MHPAPTITMQVMTSIGQANIDILPDSGADICSQFMLALGEHVDSVAHSTNIPKAKKRLHPPSSGIDFQCYISHIHEDDFSSGRANLLGYGKKLGNSSRVLHQASRKKWTHDTILEINLPDCWADNVRILLCIRRPNSHRRNISLLSHRRCKTILHNNSLHHPLCILGQAEEEDRPPSQSGNHCSPIVVSHKRILIVFACVWTSSLFVVNTILSLLQPKQWLILSRLKPNTSQYLMHCKATINASLMMKVKKNWLPTSAASSSWEHSAGSYQSVNTTIDEWIELRPGCRTFVRLLNSTYSMFMTFYISETRKGLWQIQILPNRDIILLDSRHPQGYSIRDYCSHRELPTH